MYHESVKAPHRREAAKETQENQIPTSDLVSISFEDFLKREENQGTADRNAAVGAKHDEKKTYIKRKRNSDGVACNTQTKKVKSCVQPHAEKLESAVTKRTNRCEKHEVGKAFKQTCTAGTVTEPDVISGKNDSSSSEDVASAPTKQRSKVKSSKLWNKRSMKKLQEKRRKSSGDGVVYVAQVKKATHPHLIPAACRSPVQPKTFISLPPLKNDCVLWTEKHKPKLSKDLVGNASAISKLFAWLQEWKKKVVKENEELRKETLIHKAKSAMDDDDDDFKDCGEEWDDEDCLATTGVIIGPTGCGKTAAVYTCAEELGFKVFEMNASSQRSSKHVISQLQEATRSHMVSQNKTENTADFFFNKTNLKKGGKGPSSKKSLSKLFGVHPKKERLQDVDLRRTAESKKSEVEKMSLILFEEVEVLFEEDKFFWSAVKTLTAETKRPILLVTTESSTLNNIEAKYEKFVFKAATPEQLSTCLKTICQEECCRFCFENTTELRLVSRMMCWDIRKSIHFIQFWGTKIIADEANGDVVVSSNCRNHESFQANPGLEKKKSICGKRRRRKNLERDEIADSNHSVSNHNFNSSGSRDTSTGVSLLDALFTSFSCNASGKNHTCVLKSVQSQLWDKFNLLAMTTDTKLVEGLEYFLAQIYFSDFPQLILLNWHTFLTQPETADTKLPAVGRTSLWINVPHSSNSQNVATYYSGILHADYNAMIEGDNRLVSLGVVKDPVAENCTSWKIGNGTDLINGKSCRKGSVACPVTDEQRKVDMNILDQFSLMADFCAVSDKVHSHFKKTSTPRCNSGLDRSVCRVWDGLLDAFSSETELSYKSLSTIADFEASLQTRSLAGCAGRLKLGDERIVPQAENVILDSPIDGKSRRCYQNLRKSIQSSTIEGHLTQRKDFLQDYLPALRSICRSELRRKDAKLSRRFLHYLSSINLNLKASEIMQLQDDFKENLPTDFNSPPFVVAGAADVVTCPM